MTLTPAHIRLATSRQLARLVGVSENTIANWTYGRYSISGYWLERVQSLHGIPKAVLIEGLDARRHEAMDALRAQDEVEEFLSGSCSEVA